MARYAEIRRTNAQTLTLTLPYTRCGPPPSQLGLEIPSWPASYSLPPPSSEPFQKNWVPFVYAGELLAEYSLEPHIVLHVDTTSGKIAEIQPEIQPEIRPRYARYVVLHV